MNKCYCVLQWTFVDFLSCVKVTWYDGEFMTLNLTTVWFRYEKKEENFAESECLKSVFPNICSECVHLFIFSAQDFHCSNMKQNSISILEFLLSGMSALFSTRRERGGWKISSEQTFQTITNHTSASQPSSSLLEFIVGVVLQKSSCCILSEWIIK